MRFLLAAFAVISAMMVAAPAEAAELGTCPVYGVCELQFTGPLVCGSDNPVLDIDFWVEFQHERGSPTYRVHGFWDADGGNGTCGSVWKVRFCPTENGAWYLQTVFSNRSELNNQKEGDYIAAVASSYHGFWVADPASAGGRWFTRSDGTHEYIIGNTHYDLLSRPHSKEATPATIRSDIAANALYFKKVRFCLMSFRTENASTTIRPFLSGSSQTNTETNVPYPRFFRERVDAAVDEGFKHDLICDLILGGTTGDQVANMKGYLKYVAARYGSYPHVWFCLGNEWNEKTDASTEVSVGNTLRSYMAYPNPVSTHGTGRWRSDLNGSWNSHSIRQGKINDLSTAADAIMSDYRDSGGKPAVNDENGYDPGEATELEVLEGITGSFAGGGYGTTGNKTGNKQGGYFWGHAAVGTIITSHPSADNLRFLREKINEHVYFWNTTPVGSPSNSIFISATSEYRVLEWENNQYVLLSDASRSGITVNLPSGLWDIIQLNIVAKSEQVLGTSKTGSFTFPVPSSRAVLTIFTRGGIKDPDIEPPTIPDNVTTTAVSSNRIDLTWNPSTDNVRVNEYVIQCDGPQTLVARVSHPATAYTLSSLIPSTQYCCTVEASDAAGNTSGESSLACAITTPADVQTYTITATAGIGGAISPSGPVTVEAGASQTFTISSDSGYQILDVFVDGFSQGGMASYGFNNVMSDHTISATFRGALSDPQTVILTPEADTYVYVSNPNSNYGSEGSIAVGGGTTRREIYLRFNVPIPTGALVTDARLVMKCTNSGDGGTIRRYAPSNETWGENIPTWNNPLTGQDASVDLFSMGHVKNAYTYEFTGLESAVSAGQVTFVIRSGVQEGAAYASKESAPAPALRVTYMP